MKKIFVACGAGVVTSTIAITKLKEGLEERNIPEDNYKIGQGSVGEIESNAGDYDAVLVTSQYESDNVNIPIINGISLLTGVGADSVIDQIASIIQS
ncbi:PTS sugar transporter subunit IIB [Oenococcus sicerae]|uniref:PTS sugar transporter subunit IIB n=1 Tax=Oenococcus sicerae TaxID=2203724 RepID=A0ABX5QNI2_9LACO|nr:PTS sugar transporter subunit IIB [Oenococcus sicerae]QAS70343.1 PTS sugar transporter subunit IIB [Oenococcus sicerae]VDK13465.1 hypothetical protein OAL24_00264 [Oenococcus sicerae]